MVELFVMVGLAAVHLAYNANRSISEWWNGLITGKRCIKNIIDSGVTMGAGIAGGAMGAKVGSFFGPIGTVIGGITEVCCHRRQRAFSAITSLR